MFMGRLRIFLCIKNYRSTGPTYIVVLEEKNVKWSFRNGMQDSGRVADSALTGSKNTAGKTISSLPSLPIPFKASFNLQTICFLLFVFNHKNLIKLGCLQNIRAQHKRTMPRVGGFTNPFEKICSSKWVHLPHFSG